MTELQINNYIDTLKFRTYNKLIKDVNRAFPNVSNTEIRNIIKRRIHDKRISRERKKIYQVKVFSTFPNSWITDIFDNLNGNDPRYWQIFININTRFVTAYPMRSKTKESISAVLHQFVNEYHPRKITSDEEAGLCANDNIEYLKQQKCGLYIIQEKNHTSLSIIDRFIRTLRDMNSPADGSRDNSTDNEFKFISRNKMQYLLTKYNNSIHSATGFSPIDMMNNSQLESNYIEKCINNKQKQLSIQDFRLKEGDLVRYYLDNDPMEKKRTTISRETYKIESRDGYMYDIIALDGTTKLLPRWKLVYVNPNEKYVLGKTLGSDRGVVDRIIREVNRSQVEVKFLMPDGSDYRKIINRKELRFPTPQFKSKIEIEFENSRNH